MLLHVLPGRVRDWHVSFWFTKYMTWGTLTAKMEAKLKQKRILHLKTAYAIMPVAKRYEVSMLDTDTPGDAASGVFYAVLKNINFSIIQNSSVLQNGISIFSDKKFR